MQAVCECASNEGIFAAPEGAASLVGYRKLIASGFLKPSDRVVLFNTGSGLKYIDVIAEHLERRAPRSRRREIWEVVGDHAAQSISAVSCCSFSSVPLRSARMTPAAPRA